MNYTNETLEYIETPRVAASKTVRIDEILELRIREFKLSRRRLIWQQFGR